MATADPTATLIPLAQLEHEGLSRMEVTRRVRRGDLIRLERGVYARPTFEPTEHHYLALVSARAPRAVVALLSAAGFHDLGTQVPHEVWIALPPRAWSPKLDSVPVQVVRFSGERYTSEIEEHVVEGVTVRIYSVAKTVVDLFRYRNKLGLDVALEALRESLHGRRTSIAKLTQIALRCGSLTPMRPYLESAG